MLLTWLIGKTLADASRRIDDWALRFEDGSVLITECLWRLVDSERILVTSFDQGEKSIILVTRGGNEEVATVFRDAAQELIGHLRNVTIRSAIVRSTTNDLQIEFDDSLTLSVVFDRSKRGAWCLQSPTLNLVALPGRLALHSKQNEHTIDEQSDPPKSPVVDDFET